MLDFLGEAIGKVFGIVDKSVPDKDQAAKLKADLQATIWEYHSKLLEAAKATIVAEAQGESLLQRIWRPITMLTFTALIVAKWLGVTAPGISEEIEIQLLEIIKIGLGGYIVGRSVEKGVKAWKGHTDNGT
ncbi:3TM-type holin [Emcibacter nanhaiensis]|uniref:Holin n=1 Tax=Emcibacter nanhaiensis TaxID=1505037 RepID=A0A501PSG1_9PROT|nr:3TM-type holin [Emcibacter nanhaiensis]TPD62992.1 hypothetical protein FIV46_02625 [Emcibacter nanhaiensis]